MIFLKNILRYVCMFNYVWRSAMYVLQSQDWMLCTHSWLLSSAGSSKKDLWRAQQWPLDFFSYPKSTSKRDLYVRYESNVIQHEIFPFLCTSRSQRGHCIVISWVLFVVVSWVWLMNKNLLAQFKRLFI